MSPINVHFNVWQIICWRLSRYCSFFRQLALQTELSLVGAQRIQFLLHNSTKMFPLDRILGTDRVEKDVLVTTSDQRLPFCITRIGETKFKRHSINFLAEDITDPCPQCIALLPSHAEH
jgi:hypothetical protein